MDWTKKADLLQDLLDELDAIAADCLDDTFQDLNAEFEDTLFAIECADDEEELEEIGEELEELLERYDDTAAASTAEGREILEKLKSLLAE